MIEVLSRPGTGVGSRSRNSELKSHSNSQVTFLFSHVSILGIDSILLAIIFFTLIFLIGKVYGITEYEYAPALLIIKFYAIVWYLWGIFKGRLSLFLF